MQNVRENQGFKLAVCSWSLQPANPQQLVESLKRIGLTRIQCALDPIREQPAVWGDLAEVFGRNRLRVISGMFGTVGEDYSSMESIARTGGVVPDETWPANWKNIQANADLASLLHLKVVSFHAGFLPHDANDPDLEKLLHRLRLVADVYAAKGIDLAFETGQETAATLKAFLEKLDRANVGVNFDPANMILYDKGDPIEALRTLGPWLKQCHLKDARKTKQPGTWGEEVAVGAGEVDWKAFFRVLKELNFSGDCCFEREAGNQRVQDIRSGRKFIESLLSAL